MSSNKRNQWNVLSEEEANTVSEETRLEIIHSFQCLLDSPGLKEISFPASFSNIDRKFVHHLARDHGFKSKSKGNGESRYITVYKNEATENNDKGCFQVSTLSRELISQHLSAFPVTSAEKQDDDTSTLAQSSGVKTNSYQPSWGRPQTRLPRTDFSRTNFFKENLPICAKIEEIIETIEGGQVTLIIGETGCGKTTQVPQIIMEHSERTMNKCQIICSMPRRVAVLTISERVAYERGEMLGMTVGYQIKLDSRVSKDTILTYCTNGVLMRSLLSGDTWLCNVTHVILDEVHERDMLTDFMLIVLRDALTKYSHLKLILMSATMDHKKFMDYFKDYPKPGHYCRVVEVPTKMYEVKEIYLENILGEAKYMSEKMRLMKEEDDAKKALQGLEVLDLSSARTRPRRPLSFEEQIAQIPPAVLGEMNLFLATALDKGTRVSFKDLVEFMKLQGIPADYQEPTYGRTALMIAAIHSDIDAVDDIVNMNPDLSVMSKEGKTALVYAEEAGDSDILEWFNSYTVYCECKKREKVDSLHVDEDEIDFKVQEMIDIYEKCHIRQDIDEDLILCVLEGIHAHMGTGAVLVFLPGFEHIMSVRTKIIQNMDRLSVKGPIDILLLHSRIKSEDQRKVFDRPPQGHRKVVLSTNIAETSVTIEDVVFIIDCGKVKEMSYSSMSGVYTLDCDWISQSCAQQRKGRAGRTEEGVCFRLYTKKRYHSFKPHKIPELVRESLTDVCLKAKHLAPTETTIAEFLAKAVDPPLLDATKNAIQLLKRMEALDEHENLTELGRHLLNLPVDPKFGKMIVYSIILKCLDPILTIVCCLSCGDIFRLSTDPAAKENMAKSRLKLSKNSVSDHMVLLKTFQEWSSARQARRERQWCRENFVSGPTMEMVADTKAHIFHQLNSILKLKNVNFNSGKWAVVKAAITAGLYPNIAKVDRKKKHLSTPKQMKVMVHSSSVVRQGFSQNDNSAEKEKTAVMSLPSDWLVFEESHNAGILSHLRTCTVVSPLTVCLFARSCILPTPGLYDEARSNGDESCEDGNEDLDKNYGKKNGRNEKITIKIDEFIDFKTDKETAQLLCDFRIKCHSLVVTTLNNLGEPLMLEDTESTLKTVVSLLESEDGAIGLVNPLEIPSTASGFSQPTQWNNERKYYSPSRGNELSMRVRGSMRQATQKSGGREYYSYSRDNESSMRGRGNTRQVTQQRGGREYYSYSRENESSLRGRGNICQATQQRGGRGYYSPSTANESGVRPRCNINQATQQRGGRGYSSPSTANESGVRPRCNINQATQQRGGREYYSPSTENESGMRERSNINQATQQRGGSRYFSPSKENASRMRGRGSMRQATQHRGYTHRTSTCQNDEDYSKDTVRGNSRPEIDISNLVPTEYDERNPNKVNRAGRRGQNYRSEQGRGYTHRTSTCQNDEDYSKDTVRGNSRPEIDISNLVPTEYDERNPNKVNRAGRRGQNYRSEQGRGFAQPRPKDDVREHDSHSRVNELPIREEGDPNKEDQGTQLEGFKRIRYFIIREGNPCCMKEAFRRRIWAVTERTGNVLMEALEKSEFVFLIFWLRQDTFQGYAKLLKRSHEINLAQQYPHLTVVFTVEWRCTEELMLNVAEPWLYNSRFPNRSLYETPDGGEINEDGANALFNHWKYQEIMRTGVLKKSFFY